MGARRKGRELAVQALYQTDAHTDRAEDALRLLWQQAGVGDRAKAFAEELVDGVLARREEIDGLITAATQHWKFERLASVDLNVLRLATFELLAKNAPTGVVLDEAIEIARRFGSSDSATFVNGVLDQIAERLGVKETRGQSESPR